jgi:hypothetical protein
MQSRQERNYGGRFPKPKQHSAMATAKTQRRRGLINKRARGGQQNLQLPFIPPEDWYEPTETGRDYRLVVKPPGPGFHHILTPEEIRARLAQLPKSFLQNLEVVQLSGMTRKKQSFPCYGMQWGSSLYLYPIEETLVESYNCPPTPAQRNEARMYGGRWIQEGSNSWNLVWTADSVHDFYLNNILIHELGHLVDTRNTRYVDRERYAEWFALEYGYKATRKPAAKRAVHRRHHRAKAQA